MTEIEELEHEHRLMRARNERLEKELAETIRHTRDLLTRVHEALRGIPRLTPQGLMPHDLDHLAKEINDYLNETNTTQPQGQAHREDQRADAGTSDQAAA